MANILRQVLRQSLITPRLYVSTETLTTTRLCSSKTGAGTSADAGATTTSTVSSSGDDSNQPKTLNKNELKQLVTISKVVVFMKGNPEAPRCGFSNAVVQIMRMHGVQYDAHDVLLNEALRQGVKDFTDWPTIPQVFINGEFVGGCDILLQMHQSGDLIEELKKVGIESLLLKQAEAPNAQQTTSKQDVKK